MGELRYLRGPAPAALRDELTPPQLFGCAPMAHPWLPSPSGCTCYSGDALAAVDCPLHEPQPTYFKPMPYGPDHVVNPNVCGICHKPLHRDTPHHDFEAAAASVEYATRAGWPLPTNQEPML